MSVVVGGKRSFNSIDQDFFECTKESEVKDLPKEIWAHIGAHLSTNGYLRIRSVCTLFYSVDFTTAYLQSHSCSNIFASLAVKQMIVDKNSEFKSLTKELRESVDFLFFSRRIAISYFTTYDDTDRLLPTIAEAFPNIVEIDLQHFSIEKKTIETISRLLPQLKKIYLPEIPEVKINSQEMTHVSYSTEIVESVLDSLPLVETLSFDASAAADGTIATLARFTSLQELTLTGNPKITGFQFNTLPISLKVFRCVGAMLKDFAITALGHLKSLEVLCIDSNPDVTGSTFGALSKTIKKFSSTDCDLTDDAIASMEEWKDLESLNIAGNTKITGAGFDKLQELLKELFCYNCSVTPNVIDNLTHFKDVSILNFIIPENSHESTEESESEGDAISISENESVADEDVSSNEEESSSITENIDYFFV